MDSKEIGKRLLQARTEAGMTLRQVATRANVSDSTVMRYENGEITKIKLPMIESFSRILGVNPDWVVGKSEKQHLHELIKSIPAGDFFPIRIAGTVRAGYGGVAFEDFDGVEIAAVKHPENYIYFRVEGDSMAPRIEDGDLALVRIQDDVESGQLAIVVVNGEEGTIKKVIKGVGSIALQPLNPAYETRIFTGREANVVRIAGLVVKTEHKWA